MTERIERILKKILGTLWNNRVTDVSVTPDNVRSAGTSLTLHSIGTTSVSHKLYIF